MKMKKTQMYDTAEAYEVLAQGEGPVGAHMVITKVVREHVPLLAIDNGGTLGEQVDKLLLNAALSHAEVQSFEIEIEPEHWAAFRDAVHGTKGTR